MGIELTAFESMLLPESDPLKRAYNKEQAEKTAAWRVDYSCFADIGEFAVHYARPAEATALSKNESIEFSDAA